MYKQNPTTSHYISEDGVIMKLKGCGQKVISYNKNGYGIISHKGKTYYVHRLVYETFGGTIPDNLEINHINGDKKDNRFCNLELVTKSQNINHAIKLGLKPVMYADTNGNAKLTNDEYKEIIQMILDGYSNSEIADKYGLHSRYVSLVRGKKRLKSIWNTFDNTKVVPLSNDASLLSFKDRLNLLEDLSNMTNKDVAVKYDLDPSTVSKIRYKHQWKQIWKVFEEKRNDQSKDVPSSDGKWGASYDK